MRIVTFTSLFPNALDPSHGIFIYQRAAHLAQRARNEVIVVSPVGYFPRWVRTRRWKLSASIPSQDRIGALQVYYPRYFIVPRIWMPLHAVCMFLGSLARMVQLNRQARIAAIDAHFVYPDGMAAVLLGKFLGVPVVVSARGTDINVYPRFRLIRPMICWTLRRASGVIAVSRSLADAMTGLGIPAEKIHVIPNGVDTARFQPIEISEARRRLELHEGDEVVVSVGTLLPAKGHHLLIRAVAKLVPRHPRLLLCILGEGPERPRLESLATELGIGNRLRLLGKLPNGELPLWFSAANVSCLASEREGWPNVVSESLACGTPVVATRVGGIPEIIRDAELGILVDPTVESVAAGLEQALLKHWNRSEISRRARARTWSDVAEEVENLIKEHLASSICPRAEER